MPDPPKPDQLEIQQEALTRLKARAKLHESIRLKLEIEAARLSAKIRLEIKAKQLCELQVEAKQLETEACKLYPTECVVGTTVDSRTLRVVANASREFAVALSLHAIADRIDKREAMMDTMRKHHVAHHAQGKKHEEEGM